MILFPGYSGLPPHEDPLHRRLLSTRVALATNALFLIPFPILIQNVHHYLTHSHLLTDIFILPLDYRQSQKVISLKVTHFYGHLIFGSTLHCFCCDKNVFMSFLISHFFSWRKVTTILNIKFKIYQGKYYILCDSKQLILPQSSQKKSVIQTVECDHCGQCICSEYSRTWNDQGFLLCPVASVWKVIQML